MISKLVIRVLIALAILVHFGQSQRVAAKDDSLRDLVYRYQGFNSGSKDVVEINRLELLGLNGDASVPIQSSDNLVLVLVEERLLNEIPGSEYSVGDLTNRLKRFHRDLSNEGYVPRFVQCDVYAGDVHQDGLTLLAIRQFLKEVAGDWNLNGVILVGSFPEASIVRRWIWRRQSWNVTIDGTAYNGANQKDYLRIVPESVAPRADIVLADLDGNWDQIYQQKRISLESIEALPKDEIAKWPADGMIFESTKFNKSSVEFEDFFWIQEDEYEVLDSPEGMLKLKLKTAQRHPEVSGAERLSANPMSLPEILVSRINPRHIAVSPKKTFRDMNGKYFLDGDGKPQSVRTKKPINPVSMLERDPAFERKLLLEYFDRNHEFRTGVSTDQHRTAAASHGRGLVSGTNLNQYLRKASPTFGESVSFDNATLLDYVRFIKTPARLKGISAHSNSWNSGFGSTYDLTDLETEVGGSPWRWRKETGGLQFRYVPRLKDQGGAADSYIHRTIYENGLLAEVGGSLFIHNGCEVNTPEGALRLPYSHPAYGSAHGFQNAESILFFLNGVALASRSKVFYDQPRGFTDKLGEDPANCFGKGWREYFVVESNDAKLKFNVAGNKRTYPWSIIGDWTLTLTPQD